MADNRAMLQFFEWNLPSDGLLWRRAANLAKTIREAGIDMIWLPPAYKGSVGAYDSGYGVYDAYDLGEFDQKGSVRTKYGSREEYLACIEALQNEGVSVLLDIVINHRIGADGVELVDAERYDPEDRTRRLSGKEQIEAWTRFDFPGRRGAYSSFVWDHTCFTGVDYDNRSKQNGLFCFAGKKWSGGVDNERGNYDYLMGADVDTGDERVASELIEWGKWYLDTTGADGFRLDAVKHIDREFYIKWIDAMKKHCGRDLFVVGEYWSPDLNDLLGYIGGMGGRASLFDVPLHMNMMNASRGQGNFSMRGLFTNTLVEKFPCSDKAVTFVDNHDSQPGQSLESWVSEWFKPLAYAAILLRRDGLPCVFYADLYGLNSDARPPVSGLRRLLAVRRDCAYGVQRDYFDHDNIVGWVREGDDEHDNSGCAVIMSDGPGGEKRAFVGKRHAGKTFRDIMGRAHNPVAADSEGHAVFVVPGGGVCVYVPEPAYEKIAVSCE